MPSRKPLMTSFIGFYSRRDHALGLGQDIGLTPAKCKVFADSLATIALGVIADPKTGKAVIVSVDGKPLAVPPPTETEAR